MAKARPAVDHVDRKLSELIFIRKVTPQVVIGIEPANGLEAQRLQPPWRELSVIVERAFRVDLNAVAEFPDMLVERRLEPDVA